MKNVIISILKKNSFFVLSILILIASCASTSHYDQYVYTQTTSIKVDALNVMDLATEDYSLHQQEVKQAITNIDKTYERERLSYSFKESNEYHLYKIYSIIG